MPSLQDGGDQRVCQLLWLVAQSRIEQSTFAEPALEHHGHRHALLHHACSPEKVVVASTSTEGST
jgi:hypothetical protein